MTACADIKALAAWGQSTGSHPSAEVTTFSHHAFAHLHNLNIIDAEHMNRRPADGGTSEKPATSPLEVISLLVASWMIQGGDFASHWIDSGDIRPFPSVAAETCEGQIRFVGWAVVLLCNNVIRLKRQNGPLSAQVAVFTAPVSAEPDTGCDGWGHTAHAALWMSRRNSRAFDCIRSTRVPTRR